MTLIWWVPLLLRLSSAKAFQNFSPHNPTISEQMEHPVERLQNLTFMTGICISVAEDRTPVACSDGAAGAAHVQGGVPDVGLAQEVPPVPGELDGNAGKISCQMATNPEPKYRSPHSR